MKIYRYLKKEKKKKEGNKQSCWIKLKYFRSAQRYNPSIVEKSAPTLGKQRTTKCSVDEGIKRKINIPSRDKLGDGIRVKSAPTPPSSKASSFDPSRTMDRRILAPDFLISLPSNRRVIPARQPLRSCFQSKHHVHPRSIKANYLSDKFSLKKREGMAEILPSISLPSLFSSFH